MGDQADNPTLPPNAISLKKNSARAAIGGGLGLTSLVHLILNDWTLVNGSVLAFALSYYLATTLWLRFAKIRAKSKSFFSQICTLDALLCASTLAFLIQDVLVSGFFFLLILFQAMVIGSFKQGLSDMGAYIVGTSLVTLLAPIHWSTTAYYPLITAFACGAFHIGLYGYFIERRVKKVNTRANQLYSDVVRHKVRAYKLSRYVSPTVWNALNRDKDAALKTERKRVSVFFSDIAGFSSLSEELEAETLTDLLNTYLTEMVKIAALHKGTIDKFMGDGLMVIFGDTNSKGMKADCLRCVSMAIEMRRKMKELETLWFNQGIKQTLKIRMGINSGYCTVGSFGTSEYMDYTVLGTHVNLASRLESAAEPGEILVSHETWSLIKDVVMCRDRGEIQAKGFSYPIRVYQVVDFRKNLGRNQSYFEERSNGFSMHLDLEKLKNYDKDRVAERLEALAEHKRDRR